MRGGVHVQVPQAVGELLRLVGGERSLALHRAVELLERDDRARVHARLRGAVEVRGRRGAGEPRVRDGPGEHHRSRVVLRLGHARALRVVGRHVVGALQGRTVVDRLGEGRRRECEEREGREAERGAHERCMHGVSPLVQMVARPGARDANRERGEVSRAQDTRERAVCAIEQEDPMAQNRNHYELPDLPYDYSALEPWVSGKIVELHHGKHHATYVKNANTALEKLDAARAKEDFGSVAALEKALAFNLSGHVLHSIFWQNQMRQGGGEPKGVLGQAIDRDLGGLAKFKRQMNEVAASIMGSGWAALVWEPIGQRLLVTQIYDHQSNLAQSGVPLMVMDAWEHAYYLQYQNRKAGFFDALWNLWNWKDIAARFEAATRLDLRLAGAA